jgi:hypothetical protein
MERQGGSIRVTVVADNGKVEAKPRTVTLAAADVLAVENVSSSERQGTPRAEAKIVLVEEPIRAPWVFSEEDDDAPARHGELLVTESRRVVEQILAWARVHPPTYSAENVAEWDAWLAAGMPLEEDVVVLPPLKLRRR